MFGSSRAPKCVDAPEWGGNLCGGKYVNQGMVGSRKQGEEKEGLLSINNEVPPILKN